MHSIKKLNNTLLQNLKNNTQTLLAAGPMSTSTIDAIISISDEQLIPIQLIASRRQIDSSQHGGGYVNKWSTVEFAEYVNKKCKNNLVFLSRDHGGPWQGSNEVTENMNLEQAMISSKKSLEIDIDSGFRFLHLDPSIDIHKELKIDEILNRVYELYGHVYEYSKGLENIFIEIGTDLQSDEVSSLEETEYILNKIETFTKNIKHKPTFYVIQNGTKVQESENVGEYKSKIHTNNEFQNKIKKLTQLCNKYDIFSKAHNCDYLDSDTLMSLRKCGVNAINIAPEYGIIESRKIISLLKENNLDEEIDEFFNLSFNSNKFQKWLKIDTKLDDFEKAVLSGHYVFSSEEFLHLKKRCIDKLKKRGVDLDHEIRTTLKAYITNHLTSLGWKSSQPR